MSEHYYKYTHESFDLNKANNYDLLIRVNAQTFSYTIAENKTLLAWADNCPLAELNDHQNMKDVLSAGYRQVVAGIPSNSFTLIPAGLYDVQLNAGFARLLDVKGTEKVYTHPLDHENYLLFKSDTEFANVIPNIGQTTKVLNSAGWIKAIESIHPQNSELYLDIDGEEVYVLNFTENKLRFYNTFNFTTPEELAYYCALAANELKLEPETVTLILSGEVSAADNNYTCLAQFFKEVKLNTLYVLDLPVSVTPHQILNLAALSLCASLAVN